MRAPCSTWGTVAGNGCPGLPRARRARSRPKRGRPTSRFRDGAFPLITNRHEAFLAAEVSRILVPGGTFITQQVDTRSADDLYRLLGLPVPEQDESWLPLARQQLQAAGLTVARAITGDEVYRYHDVAGIIYYLRVVSWAVPEYRLDRFAGRLRELHETPSAWPASVRQRYFFIVATK